jgi:hypothetical protein
VPLRPPFLAASIAPRGGARCQGRDRLAAPSPASHCHHAASPSPASALCPHCGHATAGLDTGPAVRQTLVVHVCRACGRTWNEVRAHDVQPTRCWEPAA